MKILAKQFDLFYDKSGEALKERGMARVLENADDGWKYDFRTAAERLVLDDKEFTAEDITDIVGLPPSGSLNAIGATMSAVAKDLRLRKVGYVQATRASRHAGMIAKWKHFPF